MLIITCKKCVTIIVITDITYFDSKTPTLSAGDS